MKTQTTLIWLLLGVVALLAGITIYFNWDKWFKPKPVIGTDASNIAVGAGSIGTASIGTSTVGAGSIGTASIGTSTAGGSSVGSGASGSYSTGATGTW